MKSPIKLNAEFQYVLDTLEKTNDNLFITGRAGTGKSTLLRLFVNTTRKNVVVLAPTGVAALNAGGQTIHSFFGFPARPLHRDEIKARRYKRLYQKVDTLIIDEISMVRADLLDNMDYFMRINGRNRDLPFGDVQVVIFGDLFQLPPVVKEDEQLYFNTHYRSPYFFSADVFDLLRMTTIELRTVYRQESHAFIRLLDKVRRNRLDHDDLATLNERYTDLPEEWEEMGYITLSTLNAIVHRINHTKLMELVGDAETYLGKITGQFSERVLPTDLALKLKKGAQVMFVKNDPERRFVNGTIGQIRTLTPDDITVAIPTQTGEFRHIQVKAAEWEMRKYTINPDKDTLESEVVGTFRQYPLKLAWALTIHKSQGKTFERVVIDMGKGAFAHGQTYVALSRCTTLEGIILRQRLRPRDILLDVRVIDFYEEQDR